MASPVAPEALEAYLRERFGPAVRLRGVRRLGEAVGDDPKQYGYGQPLLVEYEDDGARAQAVLATVSPDSFGHQHMADRAHSLIWDHLTFNRLEAHAPSLDVGGFTTDGRLVSLGEVRELFSLRGFVGGTEYARDLFRLRDGGELTMRDTRRCDLLCDYLVRIHAQQGDDPTLYQRHVRELVGHSECIMGLIDSYPPDHPWITADRLRRIEASCVDWRWRIGHRTHRLVQRHGDFHPWNLLFDEDDRLAVLDRSRGEWGDAADDVVCLAINYLFFALQRDATTDNPLGALWHRFWQRYLAATGDDELLEVAAPYVAFRGLVIASPLWFPDLSERLRQRLFALIDGALARPRLDPARIDELLAT